MRWAWLPVLLAAAPPCQEDRTDLLKNGDFENFDKGMPAYWRAIAAPEFRNEVVFEIDTQEKKSGGASAHIRVTQARNVAPSSFTQEISGANWAGKTLELSGQIMTQNATYANLWIQCYDARDRHLGWAGVRRYGGLWGSAPWTAVSTRLSIPPRTATVVVRCVLQGPGEAWFDDLKLVEVKQPVTAPLKEDPEERAFRDAAAKFVTAAKPDPDSLAAYRHWNFDRISAALAKGLGTSAWRTGLQKFRAGDWEYEIYVPKEARDGVTMPLLIDPGYSVGECDAKSWVEEVGATDLFVLRAGVFEKLDREKALEPLLKKGWEAHEAIRAAFEAILKDACARLPIDPHRIYLAGYSQSATWIWSLAAQRPDRFAGLAILSGGPRDLLKLVGNAARTRLFIVQGETDRTTPTAVTREAVRRIKDAGGDPVYREHAGLGHREILHDRGNALDWICAARRDAAPKRIDLRLASSGGSSWLEADVVDVGPPAWDKEEGFDVQAKVFATIDSNRIDVKCESVKRLRLWFNEKLVDFSKPVVVVVNGKSLHDAKIRPSFDVLLDRLRSTGDGGMLFQAKLDLSFSE